MLNFPDNPNVGDLFGPVAPSEITYQWNGYGWRVAGGGISALGGFNVEQVIDLAALTDTSAFTFNMDPNYDYDVDIVSASPSATGDTLVATTSADGATFPSVWTNAFVAGATTLDAAAVNATSQSTSNDAAIVSGGIAAGGTLSGALVKIRASGNGAEHTLVESTATYVDPAGLRVALFNFAQKQTLTVDTKCSIGWSIGTTRFQGGTATIYRRSRQPVAAILNGSDGQWELVQTQRPSSGTEVDFLTGFDDGYDHEFIVSGISPDVADALRWRVREAGVWIDGPAAYRVAVNSHNDTVQASSALTADSGYVGAGGNTAVGEALSSRLYFFDPATPTIFTTAHTTGSSSTDGLGPTFKAALSTAERQAAAAADGIRFFWTAGNAFVGGRITQYRRFVGS